MYPSYSNKFEFKLMASMISLVTASEITYKYQQQQMLMRLAGGLFIHLVMFWCLIPLFLIYMYPALRNLVELWFCFIETFSHRILRTYSSRLCPTLPFAYRLQPDEHTWPIRNLRSTIKVVLVIMVIYFSLNIYTHLCFGIIFNLFITVAVTVFVLRTLWCLVDAIDYNLYPFLLIMIIQYFILPITSFVYIPILLVCTASLFPFLNQVLISHSIDQLINHIQLVNFRAYIELDDRYKQFSAEIINLFTTTFIAYHIFNACLTNNLSWVLTIATMSVLPAFLYISLISLIALQPSLIMFVISSIMLSQYISDGIVFIIIWISYFVCIYPLIYLILRRLTMKLSNPIGSKLRLIREKIHAKCVPSFFKSNSSKNKTSNTLNTLYRMVILPIYTFLRAFFVSFN